MVVSRNRSTDARSSSKDKSDTDQDGQMRATSVPANNVRNRSESNKKKKGDEDRTNLFNKLKTEEESHEIQCDKSDSHELVKEDPDLSLSTEESVVGLNDVHEEDIHQELGDAVDEITRLREELFRVQDERKQDEVVFKSQIATHKKEKVLLSSDYIKLESENNQLKHKANINHSAGSSNTDPKKIGELQHMISQFQKENGILNIKVKNYVQGEKFLQDQIEASESARCNMFEQIKVKDNNIIDCQNQILHKEDQISNYVNNVIPGFKDKISNLNLAQKNGTVALYDPHRMIKISDIKDIPNVESIVLNDVWGAVTDTVMSKYLNSEGYKSKRFGELNKTNVPDLKIIDFSNKSVADRVFMYFVLLSHWKTTLTKSVGKEAAEFISLASEKAVERSRWFWKLQNDQSHYRGENVKNWAVVQGAIEPMLNLKIHAAVETALGNGSEEYKKELLNFFSEIVSPGFDGLHGLLHWVLIRKVYVPHKLERDVMSGIFKSQRHILQDSIYFPQIFEGKALCNDLGNWLNIIDSVGRMLDCIGGSERDIFLIFESVISTIKDFTCRLKINSEVEQLEKSMIVGYALYNNIFHKLSRMRKVVLVIEGCGIPQTYAVPQRLKKGIIVNKNPDVTVRKLETEHIESKIDLKIQSEDVQPEISVCAINNDSYDDTRYYTWSPKYDTKTVDLFCKLCVGANATHRLISIVRPHQKYCKDFHNPSVGCLKGTSCKEAHIKLAPLTGTPEDDQLQCHITGRFGHRSNSCNCGVPEKWVPKVGKGGKGKGKGRFSKNDSGNQA